MKKVVIKFINIILFRTNILKLYKDVQLICMSGSPRSGTTFVAEVLSEAMNNCPIIWEPLQDDIIWNNKLKNLILRPTKEEYDKNIELQNYLHEVLDANRLNYYNSWFRNPLFRKKLLHGNKEYAIVKFVRGNGLLDVFEKISPKVKVVFGMVRNPYSVISSQLRHHEFKGHPAYSQDSKYINEIKYCIQHIEQTLVRDLAITWCVDYLNAVSSSTKIFYFEEIRRDPQSFVNFFKESGIIFYKDPVFTKISSTYVGDKINTNFEQKYKEHLNQSDIYTISEVVKVFNIQYPKFN